MKKSSIKNFIGRQLSRLRLGQTYYSIIITTVGTISLVSFALKYLQNLLLRFFQSFISLQPIFPSVMIEIQNFFYRSYSYTGYSSH